MKKEKWKSSDSAVASIGYGYGLSISPLHLAASFSAIVNGGLYNTPTLLQGKYNPDNSERVLSDSTSKLMRKLLRAVVVEGSGRNANVLGYEVGGKTGTANKQDKQGRYINNHVNTTFLAAFPISNPQYVLVVMMDDPKATKDTFGFNLAGWNVVPAAAEIISDVAPQLDIPANADIDEKRNKKIIEAAFSR
jgi:cell division protein FtsI (penicillin-binding protein 3)